MKNGRLSFRVIGDSGPLSISWFRGPKGDAVESKNALGVGFFSLEGQLLGVEFDDVNEVKDQQVLEFDHYRVSVTVDRGKVSFTVSPCKTKEKPIRTAKKNSKRAA